MATVEPLVIQQRNKIEIQTNITAQICNFTNEVPSVCKTEKCLKVTLYDEMILQCKIYNSNSELQNRGYLLIEINHRTLNLHHKRASEYYQGFDSYYFNLIVSVIDIAGNKRFTRSFLQSGEINSFGFIDRYLSRQTLLNDPTEFLPNDILTIELDISFVLEMGQSYESKIQIDSNIASIDSNIDQIDSMVMFSYKYFTIFKWQLFLNSEVIKTLCKVSTFFRDIIVYTAGDNSDYLKIPRVDRYILINIFKIVKGIEYEVQTIDEIFSLLRVSDKYDILNLPEICRQVIKEYLDSELQPCFSFFRPCALRLLQGYANKCRDPITLELFEAFEKSQVPSSEMQVFYSGNIDNIKQVTTSPAVPNIFVEQYMGGPETWFQTRHMTITYEPSLGFKLSDKFVSKEDDSKEGDSKKDDSKEDDNNSYFN